MRNDRECDLRSPINFARSLNLRPTPLQRDILATFEKINSFTAANDPSQEMARGFALAMLWQALTSKGSKCVIISSEPGLGRVIIGFLHTVIKQGPQSLVDISNFPSWKEIQFGTDPGWGIQLLTEMSPQYAFKLGAKSRMVLVIGESSSEPAFVETKDALIDSMKPKNKRVIHLW